MQRIIFVLLILQTLSFACLTCNSGAIYVTTKLTISIENDHITNIQVHWDLDPIFSQIVLGDFDINRNKRFDPEEILDIRSNLLPMQEYNFFIDFDLNGTPIELYTLENFHVQFAKGLVSYHFDIPLHEPVKEPVHFKGGFKDLEAREGSIFYRFDKDPITLLPENAVTASTKTHENTDRDGWITQRIETQIQPTPLIHIESKPTIEKNLAPEIPNVLARTLREMTDQVHNYLVTLQEKPSITTVVMILLLSFLYGMLHAAGPGHGKMLVASYFVSNDRSYMKAITMGLMIAIVHVFSALILTMMVYYLIDAVFSKSLEEASRYITIGSGISIIMIAVYLFQHKWRFYKKTAVQFSTQLHQSSCGCHGCQSTKQTDLAVVLFAGIIPCPGTVIIFMFALSMGLYTIGITSAIIMSLGMGFTIALTAIISTKAKRSTQRLGSSAIKLIEFGSIIVMAILGSFLLFA